MRSWQGVIAAALLGMTTALVWLTIHDARESRSAAPAPGQLAPDVVSHLQLASDRWISNLQARIQRQRATNQSRRAARRVILAALGGTSMAEPVRRAGVGDVAKARIDRLDGQLAGLPRERVRVRIAELQLDGLNTASATVEMRVILPSPARANRSINHSVHLDLRRRGGQWTLADVEVNARGLLVLDEPLVVEQGDLVLVGERIRRDAMMRLAELGNRELPRLTSRYGDLAGRTRSTTFVLEDRAQTEPLLGRRLPDIEQHAPAWTYESGDIVVNWARFGNSAATVRDGTYVHELTHLVLRPVSAALPVMLSEGLAMREEISIPEAAGQAFDLAPLNAAFRDGTVSYLPMLRSDAAALEGDPVVGYLAGYATVSYLLERGGDAALLRFLAAMRSGLDVDEALRRHYRITPSALRGAVRRWAAAESPSNRPDDGA